MKHILVGILVGLMLAFTGVAEAYQDYAPYGLYPELITNGDFGTGNLDGWTVLAGSGGAVASVESNSVTSVLNVAGVPGQYSAGKGSEPPAEFVRATGFAAKVQGDSMIKQSISTSAGEVYRLAYFYDASNGYQGKAVVFIQGAAEIYDLTNVTAVAGTTAVFSSPRFKNETVENFGHWVKQVYLITVPNVANNTVLNISLSTGGSASNDAKYDNVSLRKVISSAIEALELRVSAIEAQLADGVGLSEEDVNTLIDLAIADDNDADDLAYAPIGSLKIHAHDKGSGGRMTGPAGNIP